jgi:hypothetical protein
LKIETNQVTFNPIVVTITIEHLDELTAMINILGRGCGTDGSLTSELYYKLIELEDNQ